MTNLKPLDENYDTDYIDAMADLFEEQREAMRESNQQEWEGVIHDNEDS